jgi:hypothetical protein
MALDFQRVYEQVKQLGVNALRYHGQLKAQREKAEAALESYAQDFDHLRQRVQLVLRAHDPALRCAMPVSEPLDAHYPLPQLPSQTTILAADGSQIAPDRNVEVEYCLINVGAIQMRLGLQDPPVTNVRTELFYGDGLYTPTGTITDARLALMRDLGERTMLAELATEASPPAIAFTDGPMELWSQGREGEEMTFFQKSLEEYLKALSRLYELRTTTAGYVDKPAANLVIRLLEVMLIPDAELSEIRTNHPLRGASDADLYRELLEVGERSPVFALQSQFARNYREELALHFFYLNVGQEKHPWLARVEIPKWVAEDSGLLNNLHAVLVDQCRVMGNRPYPYLLHRAHEVAVVTQQEKEQVTQMIALELRKRGVMVGEKSYKQSAKDLDGRTRY